MAAGEPSRRNARGLVTSQSKGGGGATASSAATTNTSANAYGSTQAKRTGVPGQPNAGGASRAGLQTPPTAGTPLGRYSYSSLPVAVRSRIGVDPPGAAATGAGAGGGAGTVPVRDGLRSSRTDLGRRNRPVPPLATSVVAAASATGIMSERPSTVGRSAVQRILDDATPRSGGVGGIGGGAAGAASEPPTECDAQAEVAAAGIIAACQDSGVCDAAMRGITRLPPALLRYFRAEGGLVRDLQLQGNRLASPPPLELLPGLTHLDLSANLLTSAPASLGCLTRLRSLDLSRNGGLESLPEALCDLTCLTSLDLSHNALECLPLRMERLVRLVELRLDSNRLSYLPAGAAALPSLTALHASHNRLTALPSELGGASSLTGIFLGHNMLTAVPASIGEPSRETPSLSPPTRRSDAPSDFVEACKLRVDGLSRLWRVPGLSGSRGAGHERLAGALRQRLAELQLHNNHLAVLPSELGRLLALTRLTSGCNPLVHPPREVAARGVAAVREYLLACRREAGGDGEVAGSPEGGAQPQGGCSGAEADGAADEAADIPDGTGGSTRHTRQPLRIGASCVACADKDDRIEELGQLLQEARERCGRAERQLEQCREQLARQAKDLAAQAQRATEADGEIAHLHRQLTAASLLPGFRGPPPPQLPPNGKQAATGAHDGPAGRGGGDGGTGARAGTGAGVAPRTQEERDAHMRQAQAATEAARAAAEAAEREAARLRQRAEAAEREVAALRADAAQAAESFRRERERCDAATLAATEAERVAAELVPLVAERDGLRRELQAAKVTGDEAWRAAHAAREGHHNAEASADMAQGRLAAAEAVNRRLQEQIAEERRAAAVAAAAADSRERQLQVELSRLRADLAALVAERGALHGDNPRAHVLIGVSTHDPAAPAVLPGTTVGGSGAHAWIQPQLL